MESKEKIGKFLKKMTKDIESINKKIEEVLPQIVIKKTVLFGNSSHIVLSKDFLDKKVGVIILSEENKKRYNCKEVEKNELLNK